MCDKFKTYAGVMYSYSYQDEVWILNAGDEKLGFCPFCGSKIIKAGCSSQNNTIVIEPCFPEPGSFIDQSNKVKEEFSELEFEVDAYNLNRIIEEGIDLMTATWGLVIMSISQVSVLENKEPNKIRAEVVAEYKNKLSIKRQEHKEII